MNSIALPVAEQGVSESKESWRSLQAFSLYRIVLALLLAGAHWGFAEDPLIGAAVPWLARSIIIAYCATGLIQYALTRLRAFPLDLQLSAQILVDIAAIIAILHASGGIRGGAGLLLLVTLAAAGLIARGRMVFFHAAVATIALLVEQGVQILHNAAPVNDYFQTGLLAGGYFAIAGLAARLATFARGAERIAEERGVNLANLAQINELVIRDMQDGFLVVDEKGLIRQHNTQCEALLGPLGGKRHLSAYAPLVAVFLDEWRRDRAHLFPMLHDARMQNEYQVRFVAIGREPHDDKPSPTVIFIEDMSRIRIQAQQMKLIALGRLTASIAHEIRNPLSSIGHAAQLLHEEDNRTEGDRRLLAIIRDNTQRLDRMVQEVLVLNRRDRAQPEAIDAAAHLRQFVGEFCGIEKVPLSALSVTVTSPPKLHFDRSHFDQVLWNLSRNAWRFCRKETGSVHLALGAGKLENTLCLDVIDDGPGVSASAQQHLFEPFFTTDAQGTGLGLYIARELAEVNGARLEYFVDSPGAHFRLTMKAA
jgi:two-component system sensor histidine kinase PilS (NtrC family)